MQTKKGNRGQTLVRVQNVDTGVIVWKEKESYERSRAQWGLAPDEELEAESVEDKIEDVIEEVEDILDEVKKVRKPRKASAKKK